MLHIVRLGQVVTGECYVCGEELTGGVRAGQEHIARCARENIDAIRESRKPVFDDSTVDTEVEAHMRKVGKRMLAEGRMTMRKNERVE